MVWVAAGASESGVYPLTAMAMSANEMSVSHGAFPPTPTQSCAWLILMQSTLGLWSVVCGS